MKRFKKYILMLLLLFMVNVFSPLKISAQPSDPGCDPLDPNCPIDGGVSLLVAIGIGLGAKRVYSLKSKDSTL